MPTDYSNIFRKSPPAEAVVSRFSVLQDLQKLMNQVDAIVTALQRHQRKIDGEMMAEQAEIDFAARFNVIIVSKKMPPWKVQFAALTKAVETCDTHRVSLQQIEKTVRGEKKWIREDDLFVEMVDLEGRKRTALQEQALFIVTMKEFEEESGLSFVVSGENETERERFIVHN
ncbi:hypothetical protein NX059_001189 [Plenodomus lindquistii]|nr:hypothetical protein NX059_001189 [Plenodomus lindquistii]